MWLRICYNVNSYLGNNLSYLLVYTEHLYIFSFVFSFYFYLSILFLFLIEPAQQENAAQKTATAPSSSPHNLGHYPSGRAKFAGNITSDVGI